MKIEKVRDFAKEQGFNDVLPLEKWKGFDVYEPVFNREYVSYIGPPLVILVKDETIRMSTVKESYELLHSRI